MATPDAPSMTAEQAVPRQRDTIQSMTSPITGQRKMSVEKSLTQSTQAVASITVEARFDNSGRYAHIQDLLPNLMGAELQKAVDQMYLIAKDVTLQFVSAGGEWRNERDPLNDRGDEGEGEGGRE